MIDAIFRRDVFKTIPSKVINGVKKSKYVFIS